MFLIPVFLIMLVYCESIAGQMLEEYLSNPCFSVPDSLNCTLLMCTQHNVAKEDCQNFSSTARFEIYKMAKDDKLPVSQEHSISPYVMGVACFALGFRMPSEQGCASCLFCELQFSSDVCNLFCKTIHNPTKPLPSSTIIHSNYTFPFVHEAILATSQSNKQKTILELNGVFSIIIVLILILGVAFVIGAVVLYRFICARHRRRRPELRDTQGIFQKRFKKHQYQYFVVVCSYGTYS